MIREQNKLSWLGLFFNFIFLFANTSLQADVWNMPHTPFALSGQSTGSDLSLAANSTGGAFAIWNDDLNVQVSQFVNDAWGPAVTLDSTGGYSTHIAMDDTGVALAIWLNNNEIRTAYYDGTTWVTPSPSPLDTLGAFTANPAISIAMEGIGIATWIDSTTTNVRSSTFTAGSWSVPTTIGTGDSFTSVAVSYNGTAVAEWSSAGTIMASNYIGGVWQVPVNLGLGTFGVAQIDANGNAIASWLDAVGNVVVSFFNGATWSAPLTISTSPGNQDLSFAMAPGGTAVLVWIDSVNDGQSSTFNGTSWSSPFLFANGVATTIGAFLIPGSALSVSVDTSGDALLVWTSLSGEILSVRLPLGTGVWIDPSLISNNIPEGIINIDGALAESGRGFAVWQMVFQSESSQVFGSFTILPIPTPPLSISGRSCNNNFASQTDRINIITWTPSLDPSVTAYYLRRNGVLIAIIPASGPFIYYDHKRCKNKTDIYTVVAVSPTGESLPLTIIL